MRAATRRHHGNNHYDLYRDLEKIKGIFSDTASDIRGRAGEILTDSIDNVREKSTMLKDGVADYTAERPFKSLGVALLIGAAVGYLLHK